MCRSESIQARCARGEFLAKKLRLENQQAVSARQSAVVLNKDWRMQNTVKWFKQAKTVGRALVGYASLRPRELPHNYRAWHMLRRRLHTLYALSEGWSDIVVALVIVRMASRAIRRSGQLSREIISSD